MLCWVMPLQNVGPAVHFINGTWNRWLSGRRGYTVSGTDHWFVSDCKSLKCFSHLFVCFIWKRSSSKLENVYFYPQKHFQGEAGGNRLYRPLHNEVKAERLKKVYTLVRVLPKTQGLDSWSCAFHLPHLSQIL